jgi:CelD/BcsL family acetyltransferase involved in cellulose biosynthesis
MPIDMSCLWRTAPKQLRGDPPPLTITQPIRNEIQLTTNYAHKKAMMRTYARNDGKETNRNLRRDRRQNEADPISVLESQLRFMREEFRDMEFSHCCGL